MPGINVWMKTFCLLVDGLMTILMKANVSKTKVMILCTPVKTGKIDDVKICCE